ncbi:DUF5667 domain-containing protein [Actinokineospora iranica]|uniref:DUF5667 domain-containing protein n=1 Tax=Actinokineospora iranica TaxID=1271860 RepID=A0A1G6UNP2_9PSEU|nr:DUF5667 domain-containing protein [Actinokineospora iranica]SDD43008.1 hypothetical protein SAMN05216174_11123 [Actinokineospora iranica]
MESGSGPSSPSGERAGDPREPVEPEPEFTDDDRADDDRAVVELLAGLRPLTAPGAEATDRMRAKILAELSAKPVRATSPAPTRPPRPARAGRAPRARRVSRPRPDSAAARAGSGARGRLAVAAIAVLALVFSLAGMSLLLARDALPGDTLYGMKRTGEAASLGLAFGEQDKAVKHLGFAAARITEIETLALRYPNPADAPAGGYLSALSDFDNDATAGARGLIAAATARDGSPLDTLRLWARQHSDRLAAVGPRLPAAARSRHASSLALLAKIEARSTGLLARFPCEQIVSGSADEIGPLPATKRCDAESGSPRVLAPPSAAGPDSGAPADARTPGVVVAPGPSEPPPSNGPPARTGAPRTDLPGTDGLPPLVSLPPLIGAPALTSPEITVPATPPVVAPLPLPLPTLALPPLLPGGPGIGIG